MKKKKTLLALFILFICLISLTIYTSFSSNIDTQEIIIKSMIPVYDETSTIKVDNENVVFNDKNQVVKYNVVLENTQNYDVKISDIKLSTPTEEFLQYTIEEIKKDDVIEANSTKELTITLETIGIKGWGRNFADELTANISFEKHQKQEEVVPPVEEDKEEKQPEAPATKIEDIIDKAEKIEANSVTNNTIEIKDGFKVENESKVETWVYPETEFYGYKEVDESNTIKEIVLEKERLDELEITPGEHNIVLSTEEKEVLGYVEIYISEDNEVLVEKLQDTVDKEETPKEEDKTNKEENKVENPYTSGNTLLSIWILATGATGLTIIILSKKKFAKYTIFIITLGTTLTLVNAEETIEIPIKSNASFESQNVMSKSNNGTKEVCYDYEDDYSECFDENIYNYFWKYNMRIQNIYIQNEKSEITDYAHKYDVTEKQNARVTAYLVELDNEVCYIVDHYYDECDKALDLYIQADGVIYPNPDASDYFYDMINLEAINNIEGLDTSNITDMSYMFYNTGYNNPNFSLDLRSFDTSNVTDMSWMFCNTGAFSSNFNLDLSSFDTRKVTNMMGMFNSTGSDSQEFTLNFGDSFDTSNVTNMSYMFETAGYISKNFTLDVSQFDTSKVTNMENMFYGTGYSSTIFTLDVSNFDTSNVTHMDYMFYNAGHNSDKLDIVFTIKNANTHTVFAFNGTALKEGTKVKVNYTNLTKGIANIAVNSKTEGANVVLGDLIEEINDDELSIGDEVQIANEYFNVMSINEDTITLLVQYNLGTDYRQTASYNPVKFSDTHGWEYTPGPKEIDIETWSPNIKTYLNNYVEYLKETINDENIKGNLITLKDLETLGCTIPVNYDIESEESNCYNSPYGWIVNNQLSWTRSANSTANYGIWYLVNSGPLNFNHYRASFGVRPTITISKSSLENYLKTS